MCDRSTNEGGGTKLTWTFSGGATFVDEVSAGANGYEGHSAALRLPAADAVKLLRGSERVLYPPKGCGIDWSKPASTDKDDTGAFTAYESTTMSCHARVYADGDTTTQLVIGYSL